MINNFRKFHEVASEVYSTRNAFARLGILLTEDGGLGYNWETVPYIADKVVEWGMRPALRKCVALALAVKQEEQNNFIAPEDIMWVNNFFKDDMAPITFEYVQQLNREYI